MRQIHIRIADWSVNPGLRYRWQSTNSGEEYFDDVLMPIAITCKLNNERLVIDLDGTRGYASSFIDQVYGRLVEELGYEWTTRNVETKTLSRPWLADEADAAINDHHAE